MMHRKCLFRFPRSAWAIWLLAFAMAFAAQAAAPATAGSTGDDVLRYVTHTIDWYRRVSVVDQMSIHSQEVLFRDTVHEQSRKALDLGLNFATAQAAVLSNGSSAAAGGADARKLAQAATVAAQRVSQIQGELDQLQPRIDAAPADAKPALIAQRDKLTAELNLAKARQNVVQDLIGFQSDGASAGLAQKIEDLRRSVGATGNDITKPAPAASAPQVFRAESTGILGLISELFSLSHRMGEVHDLTNQTAALIQHNQKLRDPIRAELVDALHRADALAATTQTTDPRELDRQRQQIDAVTSRFKLLAAAGLPLREQSTALGAVQTNLEQWHATLGRLYGSILRTLGIRLGAIAAAIIVLLGISSLWKRATFKYVSDVRRRRQFLLIRRIAVGTVIVLILIAGVVTELSSLATFAGLITAGIAVALQTVILSGAAHFFFMGRYGVRVGDRVTISGITGDVAEIGVFRLYLIELTATSNGRDLNPTGRIVVFSNSVLFQPSAFYKQIPGIDYTWHEIAMTLSPDTDYHLAEKRLLEAVQSVYSEYGANIERQFEEVKESIHFAMATPRPQGRLRFVEAGLEFAVRYPVELHRSAEIDDLMTRRLLDTINAEPRLRLVATSPPKLQPTPPT